MVCSDTNEKQRDLLSKFMSDVSKGLLLGAVLGLASNKINIFGAFGFFILSIYMFYAAFILEGDQYEPIRLDWNNTCSCGNAIFYLVFSEE